MEEPSPDWVRSGIAQLHDEITLFLRTLWGFLRHPRTFTRGFLRGDIRALNPFGYLFTAIGAVGVFNAVVLALLSKEASNGSVLVQALRAALPPTYYVVIGLITHALLWLLGSRRRHVRDTAAVALYAAGPAYLSYALLVFLSQILQRCGASEHLAKALLLTLSVASICAFAIPFVAALREIHDRQRGAWRRCIAAFGFVFVASGFFFGFVRPPGSFGLHPTIGPLGGGIQFAFGNWSVWIALDG